MRHAAAVHGHAAAIERLFVAVFGRAGADQAVEGEQVIALKRHARNRPAALFDVLDLAVRAVQRGGCVADRRGIVLHRQSAGEHLVVLVDPQVKAHHAVGVVPEGEVDIVVVVGHDRVVAAVHIVAVVAVAVDRHLVKGHAAGLHCGQVNGAGHLRHAAARDHHAAAVERASIALCPRARADRVVERKQLARLQRQSVDRVDRQLNVVQSRVGHAVKRRIRVHVVARVGIRQGRRACAQQQQNRQQPRNSLFHVNASSSMRIPKNGSPWISSM